VEFDVPGWVATVLGADRDELAFESEQEVDGYMHITYTREGSPVATVTVIAMPMADARRASWQLAAQIGDRLEQVQVPARTRFVWR
jgi:hypothetical protein